VLDSNFAVGCGPGTDYILNTFISIYARTNRRYNERDSRNNYVHSSIPHCTCYLYQHYLFTLPVVLQPAVKPTSHVNIIKCVHNFVPALH
jgi:hypothetical protein